MSAAAAFSSRYRTRLVPGIGTTAGLPAPPPPAGLPGTSLCAIPLLFDEILGRLSNTGGRKPGRTAFLHVDRTADVPRLRAKLTEIVTADPLWDGRVCGLQVTDSFPTHIELRCLVSAADAGRAFDLRCNVREAMTAYIATEMPDAIPRQREEMRLQPLVSAEASSVTA